jgi:hypothetical protein
VREREQEKIGPNQNSKISHKFAHLGGTFVGWRVIRVVSEPVLAKTLQILLHSLKISPKAKTPFSPPPPPPPPHLLDVIQNLVDLIELSIK